MLSIKRYGGTRRNQYKRLFLISECTNAHQIIRCPKKANGVWARTQSTSNCLSGIFRAKFLKNPIPFRGGSVKLNPDLCRSCVRRKAENAGVQVGCGR